MSKKDGKDKPEIKVHTLNLNDLQSADVEGIRRIADQMGDDVPKEVRDAVEELLHKVKEEVGEPFASEAEAQAEAMLLFGEPQPPVGALVKRKDDKNEAGHQATIVLDAWPHYKIYDKRLVNGVVITVIGKGAADVKAVDLRDYVLAIKALN